MLFNAFFESLMVSCATGQAGRGVRSHDGSVDRRRNNYDKDDNNCSNHHSTTPVQHLSLRIPRQVSYTTATSGGPHDQGRFMRRTCGGWWCNRCVRQLSGRGRVAGSIVCLACFAVFLTPRNPLVDSRRRPEPANGSHRAEERAMRHDNTIRVSYYCL
jgi:hypothetical protein